MTTEQLIVAINTFCNAIDKSVELWDATTVEGVVEEVNAAENLDVVAGDLETTVNAAVDACELDTKPASLFLASYHLVRAALDEDGLLDYLTAAQNLAGEAKRLSGLFD